MARDNGQGIFTMDFIKSIERKPLPDAKVLALDVVNASPATPANKQKATTMLNNSNTLTKLLIGMSNFSLSHQGLKSMR